MGKPAEGNADALQGEDTVHMTDRFLLLLHQCCRRWIVLLSFSDFSFFFFIFLCFNAVNNIFI